MSKYEISAHSLPRWRKLKELLDAMIGRQFQSPWAYRAGGRGGRQPAQFVGQTKPVGQYSLYSRAILAHYKKKWDKFCQFFEKFHIGKICMMFRKI
jgi:hypothetical protein